jgi:tRNA C32,U32 (ribose-2'-O)-methylase TrmJ
MAGNDDAEVAEALEEVLQAVLAADEAGEREKLAGLALDLVTRAGVAEADVRRLRAALRQAITQAPSGQGKTPSCA